jgi:hypothetical protein
VSEPDTTTVTVGGVSTDYPTPLAAVLALLVALPTEQLGTLFWADAVRRIKLARVEGLPGAQGEVGKNAVRDVR